MRAANLETAFTLLALGETGDPDEIIFQASAPQPNEQLLIELRGVRRVLEQMSVRLDSLQDENVELRAQLLKQLEAPKPPRVGAYPVNTEKEQLQAMNRYLLSELERRRLEAESKEERRGFWGRLWGRE